MKLDTKGMIVALGLALVQDATAAGTLDIRGTQPSRVFLDGERIGETPLRVQDVAPGEHRIRIQSRTTLQVQDFVVKVPRTVDIHRTLEATFPTAGPPLGAVVTPLPASGPVVTAGAPAIVTQPTVVAGRFGPTVVQTVPASIIRVRSNRGATVYFDEQPIGEAPLEVRQVPPGFHVLKVRNPRTGETLTKPLRIPDDVVVERTVDFKFRRGPQTVVVVPTRPRFVVSPTPRVVIAPSLIFGRPGRHHSRRGRGRRRF